MRKLISVGLCLALMATGIPFTAAVSAQAYDPCMACKPMRSSSQISGNYNVCINTTGLSSNEINGYKQGINYWNDYLNRPGFVGGLIPREDGAHGSTEQVSPRVT